MRNLLKIHKAQERGFPIRCPNPLIQKRNILVMDFIGNAKEQIAAPRLKDANIETSEQLKRAYDDTIIAMKVLYSECRLVHADLSEYNILY